MKIILGSLAALLAAVVCSSSSFFVWAQEGQPGLPSGFVMSFERTGGYAGIYESFWIYPDGRVMNPAGETAKIPPELLREWLKKITSPPVLNPPMESSCRECFDCFIYLITLYEKDGTRTIKRCGLLEGDSDVVTRTVAEMRDKLLHLAWIAPAGTTRKARGAEKGTQPTLSEILVPI